MPRGGIKICMGEVPNNMKKGVLVLSIILVFVLVLGGLVSAGGKKEGAAGQEPAKAASTEDLAQKYKNAKPGDSFLIGHITWHLGQEYAIMVYQAIEQACNQMGLKFRGAVAKSQAEWAEITESMIAAGAKAIIYNVPDMSVMKQVAEIANQNNVFIATYFGYTGDIMPGDFGPRWVIDNTPFSDEQTFIPLTCLFQKMKDAGKTKMLIHQASKSAATVSTVYINLGIYQALQKFPEMKLMGFQYGEWGFEGGRAAAEASLAVRKDYEGLWGANDSQTMGALRALEDRGVKIGPYTASRDMEMTTAQEILKGNFLCTSGFAIPYFGGRLVPMLYDMCVGAWYPTPEEMLQTGTLDLYGRRARRTGEEGRYSRSSQFQHGTAEGKPGTNTDPDEARQTELSVRFQAYVYLQDKGIGFEVRQTCWGWNLPWFP